MEIKQIYKEEMSKAENVIEINVDELIINEELVTPEFFTRPKKDYVDYLNGGDYLPIVVQDNKVCDGNHRVIVAKEIGMEKIKAIDIEECKRVNERIDNRLKTKKTQNKISEIELGAEALEGGGV